MYNRRAKEFKGINKEQIFWIMYINALELKLCLTLIKMFIITKTNYPSIATRRSYLFIYLFTGNLR